MEKQKFTEVERKWILKNTPNRIPDETINMIQYYAEGDMRYRRESSSKKKGESFYRMKKTSIGVGASEEEVEKIDLKEFWEVTQKNPYMIRKKRFVYNLEPHKIEIDVFQNMSLVLMEIEVNSLEEELQIPEDISKYIIKEVTGDPHFTNKHLSGYTNQL